MHVVLLVNEVGGRDSNTSPAVLPIAGSYGILSSFADSCHPPGLPDATQTILLPSAEPFVSTPEDESGAVVAYRAGIGRSTSTPVLPPGIHTPSGQFRSDIGGKLFGSNFGVEARDKALSGLGNTSSLSVGIDRQLAALLSLHDLRRANSPSASFIPPTAPASETNRLDENSFPALPKPSRYDTSKKTSKLVITTYTKATTESHRADNTEFQNPKSIPQPDQELVEGFGTTESHASRPARRPNLGKLDIAGANLNTTLALEQAYKPETPEFNSCAASATDSRPATPGQTTDTTIKRAVQRHTLRATTTPNSEIPPDIARVSPGLSQHVSRKPSLASINVPGTPASDFNADSVSIATDSISRASSPRPSRIGSAPVRLKTKSQTKKDRIERAKVAVDINTIMAGGLGLGENTAVAPIMGRKKKIKSNKTANLMTTESTPDVSRPPSPRNLSMPVKQGTEIKKDKKKEVEAVESQAKANASMNVAAQSCTSLDGTQKEDSSPSLILEDAHDAEELRTKLADLLKISFNLAGSGRGHHGENQDLSAADIMAMATPRPLTMDELTALDRGEAIRRDAAPTSRLMISPSRKCLPRLARDLEDRYLELEKSVLGSKPPARYTHASKDVQTPPTTVDAMLVDMAAVLIRRPLKHKEATAPAAHNKSNNMGDGKQRPRIQGPPSTSYASDALAYLNQFILPPLPQAPRAMPPRLVSVQGPKAAQSAGTIGGRLPLGAANAAVPLGVGSAIPRTYTTGDPTYSVSGVDVNAALAHTAAAAAAALDSSNTGIPAMGSGQAIKLALNEAVNGVVQAAANMTGSLDGATGGTAASVAAKVALRSLGKPVTAEEAEYALSVLKREAEAIEKKMVGLVKRNRKLAGLSG